MSRRKTLLAISLAAALLAEGAFASDSLLSAVRQSALEGGHAVDVQALLQQGGDVNAVDADGTTALAWAVHADQVTTAKALLDGGADVAATNRYGVGPMHLASENGSAEMLSVLLAHGADPNAALPDGETALMTAARTGNAAALSVLLSAGAKVDAVESWKGQTALMWAAAENNAAAVAALLAAGADIEQRSASGEFDALSFAVRGGAIEATRVLLDAGADVNAETRGGMSMLVLATLNAHYELASLLLDRGADPNADKHGWTALHQLAWSRRWNRGFNLPGPVATGDLSSLELAEKLLAAGANIDARLHIEPNDGRRNDLNMIGATPFLLAAKSCDLPLMRLLLERGADAGIPTEDGATAVMVAAGVGIWAPGENPGTLEEALAAVKLAYEAGGGDVNAVDGRGDTAVHGAVYRGGGVKIIEYLAGLGAKLDVVNKDGWTPLYAAEGVVRNGSGLKHYPEAAELLKKLLRERGIEPQERNETAAIGLPKAP
jgi:ankyrin repeat protein